MDTGEIIREKGLLTKEAVDKVADEELKTIMKGDDDSAALNPRQYLDFEMTARQLQVIKSPLLVFKLHAFIKNGVPPPPTPPHCCLSLWLDRSLLMSANP